MSGKPKEWSDLPQELMSTVVEKCDFVTRRNLRISSRSLKSLVDAAKVFLPSVKLLERNYGVRLEIGYDPLFINVLKFVKDGENGTKIERRNKDAVKVANDPIDEALALLNRICFRKEVKIGYFFIETLNAQNESKLTTKVREMLEANETPLQFRSLFWEINGNSELGWLILNNCRKSFLTDIKLYGLVNAPIALFKKGGHDVRNLARVEVLAEVEASEEDVLSLTANEIHLNLENFSDELAVKMLDRFVYEMPVGSFFMLKRSEEQPLSLKIPPGFDASDSSERKVKSYSLIHDNKVVNMKLGPYGVFVEIGSLDNPQDSINLSQRAKCLKKKDCACLEPRFMPNDDSSEFEDFDDDDDENSDMYDWSNDEMLDGSDYDEFPDLSDFYDSDY